MKRTILILTVNLFFVLVMFGQSEYDLMMRYCQSLDYLESQECMKGMYIPPFEGISYKGEKLNNQSIDNKVAVIHFWFIACPPCIAELGGLNKTVEKYKEREDVTFISFTRESKQTLQEEFLPNYQLDFEIIPDAQDIILEGFKNRWGFPTTIIVDKSGKIHEITSGGKPNPEEASKEIEQLLSKAIEECLEK